MEKLRKITSQNKIGDCGSPAEQHTIAKSGVYTQTYGL